MAGWECPKCGKVWAFWVKHCDCHIALVSKSNVWGIQPIAGGDCAMPLSDYDPREKGEE